MHIMKYVPLAKQEEVQSSGVSHPPEEDATSEEDQAACGIVQGRSESESPRCC